MHVINISLIILIYTNDHQLWNVKGKNILSLQENTKHLRIKSAKHAQSLYEKNAPTDH